MIEVIEHCKNCAHTGWVCENHPDKPWAGVMPADFVECCGGAGAPCGVCNSGSSHDNPPDTSRAFKEVIESYDNERKPN